MKVDFLSQAGKLLKEQKRFRRQMIVFFCLAVVVLYGTVTALMLYGQAMTHKAEVLDCQYKIHEHTNECYETNEDGSLGTEPVCGYADYVIHVHNDKCYNADGQLVCTLNEHEAHKHTEECYVTERILVCDETEGSGSGGDTEDAADIQEESVDTEPEKAEVHEHTDECYEMDEDGNPGTEPVCGYSESAEPEEDAAEDEPSDDEAQDVEDSDAAKGHVHTDACYEEVTRLVCGEQELHTHDDSCYPQECFAEDGSLREGSRPTCGLLQLEEHTHAGDCFKTVELTPEEVAALNNGAELHIHEDDCYDEDGKLICGHDATHIHGLECYDEAGKLICDYQTADHVHDDSCYDEDGNLICGYEIPENNENSRAYEGESYAVVVTYDDDAKIPQDAELVVEEITSDSDKEHYEGRKAEYQEVMDDTKATMQALLKIGFYRNGEEIEPQAPVTVSVQFVNGDGLTEGKPMKIVQFEDEEIEKIDGSNAKDNSTTFELSSLSEIAVGYEVREHGISEDGTLYIVDSFEHETAPFHITFQVEGEAKATDDSTVEDKTATDEQAGAASETSDGEEERDSVQSGTSDDTKEPVDTDGNI